MTDRFFSLLGTVGLLLILAAGFPTPKAYAMDEEEANICEGAACAIAGAGTTLHCAANQAVGVCTGQSCSCKSGTGLAGNGTCKCK